MLSKKNILMFLAGAQTFHTISHLSINFSGTLPIKFFFITWDQHLNQWAIFINALITFGLLWWASRIK